MGREITDRADPFGQCSFLSCLRPEIRNGFGKAPQSRACRSKRCAGLVAVDQGLPQFVLQNFEARSHRGLGDVELRGGRNEAPSFNNSKEGSKRDEVHKAKDNAKYLNLLCRNIRFLSSRILARVFKQREGTIMPHQPLLPDVFKRAMRNVATSVSVVTTDGPSGRHGATVSSFCSVSADPPMALVCLNSSSKIAECVKRNRVFNINVLPAHADAVALRFAGVHDGEVANRFDGIRLLDAPVPCIQGATVFECELVNSLVSGSHLICIGAVKAVQNSGASPLAYLDGGFQRVMPLAVGE